MAVLPLHGPFLSSEVWTLLLPALLEMLKPRNRWRLSGAMCKTLLLFLEAKVRSAGPAMALGWPYTSCAGQYVLLCLHSG